VFVLGMLIVAVAMAAVTNIVTNIEAIRIRERTIILFKGSPPACIKTYENLIYLWYKIKHSIFETD
jgi:hypothetical protein